VNNELKIQYFMNYPVNFFIFMVTYLPLGQCASSWLELAGISTKISTNILIKLFSNFVLLFVCTVVLDISYV
jgi:hypothetical protein